MASTDSYHSQAVCGSPAKPSESNKIINKLDKLSAEFSELSGVAGRVCDRLIGSEAPSTEKEGPRAGISLGGSYGEMLLRIDDLDVTAARLRRYLSRLDAAV